MVGKIITLCEEWQVSRACFDATHLKEEFSADLYTYTAHMNKHTHFIQQQKCLKVLLFDRATGREDKTDTTVYLETCSCFSVFLKMTQSYCISTKICWKTVIILQFGWKSTSSTQNIHQWISDKKGK